MARQGTSCRLDRSQRGGSDPFALYFNAAIYMRREEGAVIQASQTDILNAPPASLLNGASLFLDLDGTLVDLIDRPDEVVADTALRALLMDMHQRLAGRVAIVSGRSLAQLDIILGPLAQSIALSGSHGSEHRWNGISAQPLRPHSLDVAAAGLKLFADKHPGVIVEEKSYGVALHYRLCPAVGQDARKLAWELATDLELYLQDGKMMIELRLPGGGKDVAVRRLMAHKPMLGTHPIFIGDDWTDEPAFEAAFALGGAGILVGEERETAAGFRLADPTSVRAWLRAALQ